MFIIYFGHRVALTCFYVRKGRWVQQSAVKKPCGFEISLRDRGMSQDPPPPSGRRHQLGLNDESQSSVQTNEGHLFSQKHIFLWFCFKLLRIKRQSGLRFPAPHIYRYRALFSASSKYLHLVC